jgi:putative acetyltransferase
MTDALRMRPTGGDDARALEALYRSAFPDEDLLPLVRRLLREEAGILSLAAVVRGTLVGHVLFSPCAVDGHAGALALLGPLAVAPSWQRRGVGSALVREGLRRLAAQRVARVLVLGDPRYYRRFGFVPQTQISPPYPLPPEWRDAWQAVELGATPPDTKGLLRPPPAWLSPALWAP